MQIEKINEKFGAFAGRLLRARWWVLAAFAAVLVLSAVGVKNWLCRLRSTTTSSKETRCW